ANAQGFSGAANLVMRGFEGGGNDFALDFLESAEAGNRAGGASGSGPHTFRKILGLKELAPGSSAASRTRENHGALESVAEFADVAGPAISRKHSAGRIAQLHIGPRMDEEDRCKKKLGERQDIGAALAKRGNCERQNIQPEIKVFPKAAGFYRSGKIDVG